MSKTILWDFDGVILESMSMRDFGFKEIFKNYPEDKVDELINYHRANGGLSRYVKIRHFYEVILGKKIHENKVLEYANNFSLIMKDRLTDKNNLIMESLNFIKENYTNYKFHIVSGSDENELNYLCNKLEIDQYFISIHGSPTPKDILVNTLINKHQLDKEETCLIGDSINDFEAANSNGIHFVAYNNDKLDKFNTRPPFF
ncbi:HAD hydrolase-like protein [Maribacter sp. PR1]|uniref:phosphoglycolate phosphatase n=1 Tax=Maribacter cobaltidurans TaxID=1178778 RepID=A0ABU7IQE8_9FLAO|nr:MULTISPECIES: HAD hydrolase-like protein [Maribacter]MDC6387797.1 HAD hydrolase-like protein [Maribacter sp. PR1]MEE1975185.1 HAD hydrolase-like protein [Maribacter cobaltidurans]